MDTPALIIGAGLAGLTAALELKKKGIRFKIIEASDHPGGRAYTADSPQGQPLDLGGHWLHGGEKNPLAQLAKEWGLEGTKDDCSNRSAYFKNQQHGPEFRDNLEGMVSKLTALGVYFGLMSDRPLVDLVKTAEAKELVAAYQPTWLGTAQPQQSSAREFLSDPNGPGGIQFNGGIRSLVDRMVKEIGEENIVLNMPVSKITSSAKGVSVETGEGMIEGKKLLFTGSVGVLKSNRIAFDPPHGKEMERYLNGVSMGAMTKIILELDSAFFADRPQLKDLHIDLLDEKPALYCHVNSAGTPTITLFSGGPKAVEIENMSPEQLSQYARNALSKVQELKGFEQAIKGEPVVTRWNQDPNTMGAFSCRNAGGERKDMLVEGNIVYAGEAFDRTTPGTMAGAYKSGLNAAKSIVRDLTTEKYIRAYAAPDYSAPRM